MLDVWLRYRGNGLILVHIVHYHVFIRSAYNANMTTGPRVMKSESWNILGCRVLKLLNQFVKASLLETLDVVCHLLVGWKLKLVKI